MQGCVRNALEVPAVKDKGESTTGQREERGVQQPREGLGVTHGVLWDWDESQELSPFGVRGWAFPPHKLISLG